MDEIDLIQAQLMSAFYIRLEEGHLMTSEAKPPVVSRERAR
jgi:hypothetical protein